MTLLDELAQASYAATAKFIGCEATSQWDWASETGKNQSRAEARAVAEALLHRLIEMAKEERLDELDLQDVLASIKGETT